MRSLVCLCGLLVMSWGAMPATAQSVPAMAQLDRGAAALSMDQFGYHVATNGEFAFVSTARAPEVHVYAQDAANPALWSNLGVLSPPDATSSFGQSIDFDGDTVAIGDGGRGGAYIFERDPNVASGWSEVTFVSHPSAYVVSLKGDRLALSSPFWRNAANDPVGQVYVHERDAGGVNNWGRVATLDAPKQSVTEWFGVELAQAGDAIITGAYDSANGNRGYISIWEADAQGVWSEVFHQDGEPGELFLAGVGVDGRPGEAVAVSRTRMVFFERDAMTGLWQQSVNSPPRAVNGVSSPPSFDDNHLAHFSGQQVEVLEKVQGAWSVTSTLEPEQATMASYQQAIPLDYARGTVVLGAWRHSLTAAAEREGAAFVWVDLPDDCASALCDANALCQDALFRAECTCAMGYQGDGLTCADVDECAEQISTCDEQATCLNISGGFMCTCDMGFMGDGMTCVDVDECAEGLDDCGMNASCTNTQGGFECSCNAGYMGNGVMCVDVDECAQGMALCDEQATCVNEPGSFSCVCDRGYQGDGLTCSDIDECADAVDLCDVHASCTNTQGSFECACETGYVGDGLTCSDVDECAEGLDTCRAGETCINEPGSFTCMSVPVSNMPDMGESDMPQSMPDQDGEGGGGSSSATDEGGCQTTRGPVANMWWLVLFALMGLCQRGVRLTGSRAGASARW